MISFVETLWQPLVRFVVSLLGYSSSRIVVPFRDNVVIQDNTVRFDRFEPAAYILHGSQASRSRLVCSIVDSEHRSRQPLVMI